MAVSAQLSKEKECTARWRLKVNGLECPNKRRFKNLEVIDNN
jgi:hypothetical protein